jgi:hypothetical protein
MRAGTGCVQPKCFLSRETLCGADGPGGSRESCRLNCGVYIVLCDVFEIVIGRYVISRHFLSARKGRKTSITSSRSLCPLPA